MFSDILISIFGGGVTGVFGSILGRVASIWEKKQERAFILQKYKLDAELRSLETEAQLDTARIKSSQKSLTASYKHDSSIHVSSPWVNNIRALVRPLLTALLWILVTLVYFTLPDTGFAKSDIVQSIIYAASTATIWWFGDRGYQKNK